jgi:histidine ammonia-lyase
MHAALTAMQMTRIVHDAVAIALIALCQAIDLRGGSHGLGQGNRAVFERLRREVSFVEEDRPLDCRRESWAKSPSKGRIL